MKKALIFFITLVLIFINAAILVLLLSQKESEPKEIEIPLNISLWGKEIMCKKFHAVLNISNGNDSYYLKKVGIIIPGIKSEYKVLDIPLNETITIDYEVSGMDRLPCNSVLELTFYDYLNSSYFKYYITGY